ncbi:MAG TPA: alcohol dehydrogenase catalytic domain-containing protein, partial [Candidatus Acidoferrales bacterium]|nr:alcohol dehydrogenase catalytic domain-containing protein [Candidatus Acidoferrales bacterium]
MGDGRRALGDRMKAAVFFGVDKPVSVKEVTLKDPGPGEVRVRLKAAGLCHSDLSVIDGTIPYPVPVVLGHEGAGVIDAVGSGVTSVREGEAVIVSTLSHCGRCPACELGKPTQCRNAPSPKDSLPFTVDGKPTF